MAVWIGVLSTTCSLLFFLVLERVLNAFASLVCFVTLGTTRKYGNTVQLPPFASLQLVVSIFSAISRLVTSLAAVLSTAVSGLLSWATVFLVLFVVTGVVFTAYDQYPALARAYGIRWNESIGPRISAQVVAPYDMGVKFLSPLIPLYNVGIWIVRKAYLHALLTPAIMHPQDILRSAVSLGKTGKATAESVKDYTQITISGQTLLPYSLDVVTPMMHLRDTVAYLSRWLGTFVCSQLMLPIDILTAPLMDITFARAVHNLVNAVAYTVVQVPVATEARCRLHRNTTGLIMCIPDFDPAFQFAVTGMRLLGRALDTWLDIIVFIVRTVVAPESVPPDICESKINVAALNITKKHLFGSNNSVLVGLTETMYAETDGYSVIYYSTARAGALPEVAPGAWPIVVDTTMGVAAVTYGDPAFELADDTGHGKTTSLMGCRCDDDDEGGTMQITCAILQYSASSSVLEQNNSSRSSVSDTVFPVMFQVATTSKYLTCSTAKINVQSVRWPHTRITRTTTQQLAGSNMWWKEQVRIDAAVWVIPACGEGAVPKFACKISPRPRASRTAWLQGRRGVSTPPWCCSTNGAGWTGFSC